MNRILATLALAAAVLTGPSMQTVMAREVSEATADGRGPAVEQRTLSLVALASEYRRAAESERPALLAQLIELARERRLLLAQEAESDPAAVLKVALPAKVRDSFPAAARDELEQRAEVEGTLQVLFEEYGDRHLLRHYLTRSGRRYRLSFATAPADLLSGAKVRARGVVLGRTADSSTEAAMVVDAGAAGLEILAAGGTTTTSSGTVIPSNTFGEQRTAVLLVNFPGKPTEPWTVEAARNLVFGRPNGFIQENSSGQTWLSGEVFGWFTIPVDIATCDSAKIAWEAQKAAQSAGIDLSPYSRYVYAFPDIGCPWAGQATVGGNPSEAWFDGTLAISGIVSHEIGHNFGLAHSHALEGGSQVLPAGGTSLDYGDVVDLMGSTSAGHYNAFQKQRLGWLDYGSSPLLTHVSATGSYVIEPYAAPGTGPKALQIPQGIDAAGRPVSFYLEFRQPVGFDAFLAGSPYEANVLNGVIVHIGTEGDRQSSFLLDMTPESQPTDWNDPALTVGRSYRDPASGVTVTTENAGSAGATVRVSFAQPDCVPAPPTVAIAPAQGPWVSAGTAVNFEVTVGNADSAACSGSTFNLAAQLPAEWSGSFTQPTLTLAPGASGTASLSVTSAAGAADGFYGFAVTAGDPSRSSSDSATYVVSSAVNHAPVAVADSATTPEGVAVTIGVLANDSDPDGDPLTRTAVSQGANGTVTANSDGTVSYTPRRRFRGTDQFTYTVSDGRASATAAVTVTVIAQGKKNR